MVMQNTLPSQVRTSSRIIFLGVNTRFKGISLVSIFNKAMYYVRVNSKTYLYKPKLIFLLAFSLNLLSAIVLNVRTVSCKRGIHIPFQVSFPTHWANNLWVPELNPQPPFEPYYLGRTCTKGSNKPHSFQFLLARRNNPVFDSVIKFFILFVTGCVFQEVFFTINIIFDVTWWFLKHCHKMSFITLCAAQVVIFTINWILTKRDNF